VKNSFRDFNKKWNRFWFESYAPTQLNLLRKAVAVFLFGFYAIRALDLEWLYSQSGLLTLDTLNEAFPFIYRWSLLRWLSSDTSIYALHSLFLISLLGMLSRKYARIFTIVAYVLHLSFLQRNVVTLFGADNIATHLLFCLCLVPPSSFKEIEHSKNLKSIFGSIAFRFLQIQICVIYIYSGLEKLKGPTWWKGEAIWNVIANPQYARVNLDWAAHFPLLLSIATYLTLLWEIYFIILVWLPNWRRKILMFGVVFHAGIGFMVNIPFFSMLMIASYSVFLTSTEVKTMTSVVKSLKRLRFPFSFTASK